MKIMRWVCLSAAVGLMAGCASHRLSDDATATNEGAPVMRMNASYTSDSAGVEDQDARPPVESSMAVQLTLDQLPPSAQATVRREAGKKRVVKIRREMRDGEAVYKVELTRDGNWFHGRLTVGADGTLLHEAHVP